MTPKPSHPRNADSQADAPTHDTGRDPLELALTEFTEEKRQGKSPTIAEYVRRYPDLADQIHELFPLVDNLERWKNDKEMECLKRNIPQEFPFDRLGEYTLVRERGRGGMGVVFEAIHSTSQRSVAIKLLPWRYAADMSVWKERLQHEAATIAALHHPNIVPIYSFSEDQGYYYYVMQFVDGEGVDAIIQKLKQQRHKTRSTRISRMLPTMNKYSLTHDSWRGFAKIAEQVAIALAYAHEQGVAHNDIKPSNLLVRSNGQVIVTDFGIGRRDDQDLSDSDEHPVGTLRYMAPERWKGCPGPLADIYAVGATLYELTTQHPVFDEQKRAGLIESILHHDPPPPSQFIAAIPSPLECIILKAMSKSPADRYATANELAQDLRRFIDRQPVLAARRTLLHQTIRWWKSIARRWQRAKR